MNFPVANDLTKSSFSQYNWSEDMRAGIGQVFSPGLAVITAPIDQQQWGDFRTVNIAPATANSLGVQGIIAPDWSGFDEGGNPLLATPAASYTSYGSALNVRGSQMVKVVLYGYALALIDNTGGAGAITNNAALVTSGTTAGYLQEAASGSPSQLVATALLPSTGLGSSLGSGAVAAASQTATVGGVPAANDVLSVTVQLPYQGTPQSPVNPGTVYTQTFSTAPLTSGQAATTSSAASALQQALMANTTFAKYYTATVSTNVVTVALNAGNVFLLTYTPGSGLNAGWAYVSTSGTFGNNLSFAVAKVGSSTLTAGGATLAGGTGFKGLAPVWVW